MQYTHDVLHVQTTRDGKRCVRKNSRVQNIKVQMYVYRTGTGVFRYSAGT